MSGHSKFANIKHKKEKNDAAKGKIFTIIGREIAVAVKEGGSDPANNSRLRDVIAKAKANNMPNDTIERGIKRAALQITVTVQPPTYVMPLQRAAVLSERWAAYPLCLIKKVLLSLIKRNVTWMQTI